MVDPIITPLILTALLSAGASLISGFIGSNASQQAASTEAAAISKGIDLQARTIDQARKDSLPWMEAGKGALEQYMGELGLSSTGIGGSPFVSRFEKTPGYDFALQEGEEGVMSNLNALGMKNSGAALKALTKFRTGLASTEYNSYLGKLAEASGMGQSQVNQTNALASNSAANQSRSIADLGATRASGYAGAGSAWTNALGNFANNTGAALGKYDQGWKYVGA